MPLARASAMAASEDAAARQEDRRDEDEDRDDQQHRQEHPAGRQPEPRIALRPRSGEPEEDDELAADLHEALEG